MGIHIRFGWTSITVYNFFYMVQCHLCIYNQYILTLTLTFISSGIWSYGHLSKSSDTISNDGGRFWLFYEWQLNNSIHGFRPSRERCNERSSRLPRGQRAEWRGRTGLLPCRRHRDPGQPLRGLQLSAQLISSRILAVAAEHNERLSFHGFCEFTVNVLFHRTLYEENWRSSTVSGHLYVEGHEEITLWGPASSTEYPFSRASLAQRRPHKCQRNNPGWP